MQHDPFNGFNNIQRFSEEDHVNQKEEIILNRINLRKSVVWVSLLAILIAVGVALFWMSDRSFTSRVLADPPQSVVTGAIRHNNLGVALMDAGPKDPNYFPEAIKEFQVALELSPSYLTAKINLGMASYYAGQKEQALAALKSLLQANPDNPYVNFMLGLVHETDGEYPAARQYFLKVTQLDPNDAKAWYNLGYCLSKERQYEEAVAPLRKAASFEPYQRQFRYNLFMALNRAGKSEEAQKELDNFRKLETSSIKAVAPPKSTLEYLRQGKYAEAIADSRGLPASPEKVVPRYKDVTASSALQTQHQALLSDPGLQSVLKGVSVARSWFLDPGHQKLLVAAVSAGSAMMDYNNDGLLDLFMVNSNGKHVLLEQKAGGKFEDVTEKAGLANLHGVGTSCVWGDFDNDSWTDLVLAGYGELKVFRNNKGRFEDVTESTGISKLIPAGAWYMGIALADVDHDGDLDIFLPGFVDLNKIPEKAQLRFPEDFSGQSNLLLRNNSDGTFTNITQEAKVTGTGRPSRSVYFSDVNSDRAVDFVLLDSFGKPTVYLNQSDGSFGLVDFALANVPKLPPLGESRSYGDFNQDGSPDEWVVRCGQRAVLNQNEARPVNWLRVQTQGYAEPGKVKSNKLGIGTKVEVRSVGRWELKELRAGNGLAGCDAPEVYFDLGTERGVDFVRTVFPSGVRWTLKDVKANQVVKMAEPLLDVNSCPTLFTWDGERFRFITDTISAGILGELVTPGVFSQPDPDEWVRLTSDQLKPSTRGTFEIRWANPLEEVTYLDQVRLMAVDYPSGMEVYPNERMVNDLRNRQPNQLYALQNLRPVLRATDHHGHDVTALLDKIDRKYFDDFELLPFKGFAKEWGLTLDLGDLKNYKSPVLLLYSWSYWNSSASIVSAYQAHQELWGPVLDVKGQGGTWRSGTNDMGVSAGLPRMMVVDLARMVRSGEHVVRIRSNRTLYYDQALIADRVDSIPLEQMTSRPEMVPVEIPLKQGRLRWLGYPQRVLPDGKLPEIYDYSSIESHPNWGLHEGMLTGYGDVTPLLNQPDDHFVVMEHGEEVALAFDATHLPSLRPGWRRTYFLYSDGYEKGHELHSATATTVSPMPFHGMTAYPYRVNPLELDTPDFWQYLADWNTRPSFIRK
jgi:Flp pilus assembly protein TadD